MLSKSKYLRGVKCIKNLWLYTNKKDEQHYSEDNIRVFNRGTSVVYIYSTTADDRGTEDSENKESILGSSFFGTNTSD